MNEIMPSLFLRILRILLKSAWWFICLMLLHLLPLCGSLIFFCVLDSLEQGYIFVHLCPSFVNAVFVYCILPSVRMVRTCNWQGEPVAQAWFFLFTALTSSFINCHFGPFILAYCLYGLFLFILKCLWGSLYRVKGNGSAGPSICHVCCTI